MITEIIKVVDTLSEAKDVEREVIFEAIENALESTTKKNYTENMDVKVIIDRESGDYKTYRRWMVFADDSRELEDPDYELRMLDAVDVDKDAKEGEYVYEEIESVDLDSRIGAQIAKQVIVQKVREAEKKKVIDLYQDRIGEVLSGVVKRVDRNGFYVDVVWFMYFEKTDQPIENKGVMNTHSITSIFVSIMLLLIGLYPNPIIDYTRIIISSFLLID